MRVLAFDEEEVTVGKQKPQFKLGKDDLDGVQIFFKVAADCFDCIS